MKTCVFSFLKFIVAVCPAEISAVSPVLDPAFSGRRVEASGFLRSQHEALS